VTMNPNHPRTIPAGEFKAKCLKLLDDVQRTGEELIVTKRGKPVARLVPAEQPETDEEILAHARRLLGSVDDVDWELEDDWEANQ
jgi:prevent-host-death family protein